MKGSQEDSVGHASQGKRNVVADHGVDHDEGHDDGVNEIL